MVALVYRVREETRKLEAASSNRGAGYWINIFQIVVKLHFLIEKSGHMSHILQRSSTRYCEIVFGKIM